ncbi:MAG: hypothetical protein ACFFBZ_01890 [Promethearchaeota archaeon]
MDRRVKNLLRDWKNYGQKAMESWKYYLEVRWQYIYPLPENCIFMESARKYLHKHQFLGKFLRRR